MQSVAGGGAVRGRGRDCPCLGRPNWIGAASTPALSVRCLFALNSIGWHRPLGCAAHAGRPGVHLGLSGYDPAGPLGLWIQPRLVPSAPRSPIAWSPVAILVANIQDPRQPCIVDPARTNAARQPVLRPSSSGSSLDEAAGGHARANIDRHGLWHKLGLPQPNGDGSCQAAASVIAASALAAHPAICRLCDWGRHSGTGCKRRRLSARNDARCLTACIDNHFRRIDDYRPRRTAGRLCFAAAQKDNACNRCAQALTDFRRARVLALKL